MTEAGSADGGRVDVLVVGAGLSGIGAACRLQQQCPTKTFAVLEGRGAVGGTWDLFRYPGVRSDSDMFTLSYPFRPWPGAKAIADGQSILDYIRGTADEHGITPHIRFGTRVVGASWSSTQAEWTVRTEVGPEAEPRSYRCSFLYLCTGYYSYEHAHEPDLPGLADFTGQLVRPQFWPEDLDVRGRRVVVVGSGATAVTLVPALADRGAEVTMLQRTPSWVVAMPAVDRTADRLRRLLPPRLAFALVRAKNVASTQVFYELTRRRPSVARRLLRRGLLHHLGDADTVERHFTPAYDPWDQRLCISPEGDLLAAVRERRVRVVTDRIDRFLPDGIRVAGGEVLSADVVVSATGLSVVALGGLELQVDGERVEPGRRFAYRGMMLDGVPNLAFCVGYTNASWTLRADLVSSYVCRLLRHMDRSGLVSATPLAPDDLQPHPLLPLASGYVQRSVDRLPKQGQHRPWSLRQNYVWDRLLMPRASLDRDVRFAARTPADELEPVR